jgi:hypothetical protein
VSKNEIKKIVLFLTMLGMVSCFTDSNLTEHEKRVKEAKEYLSADVALSNKQTARTKVNEFTKLESIVFDGQNVIYTYEVDESYYTISLLRTVQSELEKEHRKEFYSNKELAEIRYYLSILEGTAIYNYVGNKTKQVLTIKI